MEQDLEEKLRVMLGMARTELGISRVKMARALKINASTLSNWENGISLPPLKRAEEIAKAYCIDVAEFTLALNQALDQHREITNVRRSFKKRKPGSVEFSGGIEPNASRRRLNQEPFIKH